MNVLIEHWKDIVKFVKSSPKIVTIFFFGIFFSLGWYLRTRNLPSLFEKLTGKYLLNGTDPYLFSRYAEYIVENGKLFAIDMMRHYPLGYTDLGEFYVLSYFINYLFKVLSIFSNSISLDYVNAIYPVIALLLSLIPFYFIAKIVFNKKIALLATAFLLVVPGYVYRTSAGTADKEALGFLFILLTLCFYLYSIKTKDNKKSHLYAALAGISTGLLWLTWGGVAFVLLTIGIYSLALLMVSSFSNKELKNLSIFFALAIILYWIIYPQRGNPAVLLVSTYYYTGLIIFSIFMGWINEIMALKRFSFFKNKSKIGKTITSLIITLILLGGSFIVLVLYREGITFLIELFNSLVNLLISSSSLDRWTATVSENFQAYLKDIISHTGLYLGLLAFFGVVACFHLKISPSFYRFKNYATIIFSVSILGLIFFRISESAFLLNGESLVSKLVFIFSLIAISLGLFVIYLKNELNVENKREFKINKLVFFLVTYFLVVIIVATSAGKLLVMFGPPVAIFAAMGVVLIYGKIMVGIDKSIKYFLIIGLIVGVSFIFYIGFGFAVVINSDSVPQYEEEWQMAMNWVRNSSPSSAVFASWWDYGYWIQTEGERATLSDPGNARGAINYLIGRYIFAAQDPMDTVQLMAAKNATHILFSELELMKYSVVSYLGSNAEFDLWEQMTLFTVYGESKIGKAEYYLYVGSGYLSEEFIFENVIFPEDLTRIQSIFLSIGENENGSLIFGQPVAVVSYGSIAKEVPLRCVFYEEEMVFEGEALESCLYVFDVQGEKLGAVPTGALFLPKSVYNSMFTKLYLFGEEIEYFELVYSSEATNPITLDKNGLQGPIKIWEVGQPDQLIIDEKYFIEATPEEARTI